MRRLRLRMTSQSQSESASISDGFIALGFCPFQLQMQSEIFGWSLQKLTDVVFTTSGNTSCGVGPKWSQTILKKAKLTDSVSHLNNNITTKTIILCFCSVRPYWFPYAVRWQRLLVLILMALPVTCWGRWQSAKKKRYPHSWCEYMNRSTDI